MGRSRKTRGPDIPVYANQYVLFAWVSNPTGFKESLRTNMWTHIASASPGALFMELQ